MEQVTNDTNMNETNILQKCSKCRKLMSINQFVNKQNRILKTCNLCCQQSLIYYKESTDHDEKEILLPKIMAKRLFDEVDIISPMKILKMNQLDFKCYIASDDFRNMEDTPQGIPRIWKDHNKHTMYLL